MRDTWGIRKAWGDSGSEESRDEGSDKHADRTEEAKTNASRRS